MKRFHIKNDFISEYEFMTNIREKASLSSEMFYSVQEIGKYIIRLWRNEKLIVVDFRSLRSSQMILWMSPLRSLRSEQKI